MAPCARVGGRRPFATGSGKCRIGAAQKSRGLKEPARHCVRCADDRGPLGKQHRTHKSSTQSGVLSRYDFIRVSIMQMSECRDAIELVIILSGRATDATWQVQRTWGHSRPAMIRSSQICFPRQGGKPGFRGGEGEEKRNERRNEGRKRGKGKGCNDTHQEREATRGARSVNSE